MSARPLAVDPRVVYRREKAKSERRRQRRLAPVLAEAARELEAATAWQSPKNQQARAAAARGSATSAAAARAKRPAPPRVAPRCACGCGKPCTYHSRHRRWTRFATDACRHAAARARGQAQATRAGHIVTLRPCAHCGATMERRRFPGGRLESPREYARRTYCDRACLQAAGAYDRYDAVCARFHAGERPPQIAAALGISREWVRQILTRRGLVGAAARQSA